MTLCRGSSYSLALVSVGDDSEPASPMCVHALEHAPRLDGILLYETCRRLGDVVVETEGLRQIDAFRKSEVVLYFVEQPHLASRKTVDGSPVIADEEVGHAFAHQGLGQRHSAGRDVLKLVNQDVSVGVASLPAMDDGRSLVDHVGEVDGAPFLEEDVVPLSGCVPDLEGPFGTARIV